MRRDAVLALTWALTPNPEPSPDPGPTPNQVRRDASAAKCWLGLGCAHLVSYLDVNQTAEELHLAHKALSQAGLP